MSKGAHVDTKENYVTMVVEVSSNCFDLLPRHSYQKFYCYNPNDSLLHLRIEVLLFEYCHTSQ